MPLHPSRDQRPAEWENVGSKIYMHPGGIYEHDELRSAKSFWRDEGDPVEGHHATRPSQGRLFDPDVHEGMVRQELGAKRMPGFDAFGDVAEEHQANEIRSNALASSVIPTSHLQPRQLLRGGEAPESRMVIERGLRAKGTLGHYTGPVMDQFRGDYVTVDPEGPRLSGTAIHEMGHRQHLGTREVVDSSVHHPQGRFPDPVKEAMADAYVDRYGGPQSHQVRAMDQDIEEGRGKFGSYQYTGYSTQHDRWGAQDRALYAGARAHYSETGEHTNYLPSERHPGERPGRTQADYDRTDPTIDATIHSLLSNSPHAAQAMRQTNLKDVGQEAFRRHRDRQLLSQGQQVQGSLLSDVRSVQTGKHLGYTPTYDAVPDHAKWEAGFDTDMDRMSAGGDFAMPHHMNHNQFGEKPRTQQDVERSLGVQSAITRHRGFDVM